MNNKETHFTFSMKLSADEYQSYYRGSIRNIVVMTQQGVRVQFPASAVRSFVTDKGISGSFVITMDANKKLVSLKKIIA